MRLLTLSRIAITLAAIWSGEVALALGECGFHCTAKKQSAEELCQWMKANSGSMPPFVPIEIDGLQCKCGCSCVVQGTLLSLSEGPLPIEQAQRGKQAFNPWSSDLSRIDLLTTTPVESYALLRIKAGGNSITATENHVFITPEGTTRKAEALRQGELILAEDGTAVEVEALEQISPFKGNLHNVVLNQHSANPADHIVSTNGLMSGDWMLQVTSDVLDAEIALRDGTSAYVDRTGNIVVPKR